MQPARHQEYEMVSTLSVQVKVKNILLPSLAVAVSEAPHNIPTIHACKHPPRTCRPSTHTLLTHINHHITHVERFESNVDHQTSHKPHINLMPPLHMLCGAVCSPGTQSAAVHRSVGRVGCRLAWARCWLTATAEQRQAGSSSAGTAPAQAQCGLGRPAATRKSQSRNWR
jgi:hypothetical protein